MKVLVTGAAGQVGGAILATRASGTVWVGCTHRDVDIGDERAVQELVARATPDVVVNAAAYTAVDKAEDEPELAYRANVVGPANLARACAQRGIPLIHLSTDFVFDGTKGTPYVEEDAVSPIGVYADTKARGDEEVRRLLEHHVILRVSWVYSARSARCFPMTMLRLAQRQDALKVVVDQRGCPTSADTIATAIGDVVQRIRDGIGVWGTYHFGGRPPVSRYEWTVRLLDAARSFGAVTRSVEPVTSEAFPTRAPRPADTTMDTSRITRVLGIAPPHWPDDLDELCRRFFAHPATQSPVPWRP